MTLSLCVCLKVWSRKELHVHVHVMICILLIVAGKNFNSLPFIVHCMHIPAAQAQTCWKGGCTWKICGLMDVQSTDNLNVFYVSPQILASYYMLVGGQGPSIWLVSVLKMPCCIVLFINFNLKPLAPFPIRLWPAASSTCSYFDSGLLLE